MGREGCCDISCCGFVGVGKDINFRILMNVMYIEWYGIWFNYFICDYNCEGMVIIINRGYLLVWWSWF